MGQAVVDGRVIPAQPAILIRSGAFNKLPTILGHNEHETRVNDFFSGSTFSAIAGSWGPVNGSGVRAYIASKLGMSADGRSGAQGAEEVLALLYPSTGAGPAAFPT